MFNLPWKDKHWPIGLDLGADSVKMMQLERSGGEIAVCACARRKLSVAASRNPQQWRQEVISAVKEMLHNGDFKGRSVVSMLSCEELSIKNIRLPKMSDRELVESVRWEADDRFSFDVDPDRLKHLRAGEVRNGTDLQDEVIMLAVSPKSIAAHMSLLDEMGLRAMNVDAEPIAVFRPFERMLRRGSDNDDVSVVMDMGIDSTRVIVARGKQIVFMKSIDIAGRRFTEAIAAQMNLSYQEAYELRAMMMKTDSSDAGDVTDVKSEEGSEVSESIGWTVHDAVRGEVESLCREVSLCLRYCAVTFRGLRPKKITVTGGQAYDPAVIQLLSEQLDIECVVGQPLRGINLSKTQFGRSRRGKLCEWAACAGLACRNIEFEQVPKEACDESRRLSA